MPVTKRGTKVMAQLTAEEKVKGEVKITTGRELKERLKSLAKVKKKSISSMGKMLLERAIAAEEAEDTPDNFFKLF